MSLLRRLMGRLMERLRSLAPRNRPLCDRCRYDYASACHNPERPNALRCSDYKRR
jgi:hypothetical protein